jgi:Fe-S-cluster containining protein
MPTISDQLCTHCGLCCDGTLFADVELVSRKEAMTLEVMGLAVEDAGEGEKTALLLQPCAALKHKRCTIYQFRPKCCRTFECRLLQEVNQGSMPLILAREKIEEVLAKVAGINRLLASCGPSDQTLSLKERCEDALALLDERDPRDPTARRTYAALEEAMLSLETLIRKAFLGDMPANVGLRSIKRDRT